MTRRELREEIFKLLFMVEFYSKEEMAEQVKSYFEDFPEKEISEKDHAYIEEKYENICAVLPEIDEKIAGAAKGWKLERIGKSDLSILRLGVYEMLYDDDYLSIIDDLQNNLMGGLNILSNLDKNNSRYSHNLDQALAYLDKAKLLTISLNSKTQELNNYLLGTKNGAGRVMPLPSVLQDLIDTTNGLYSSTFELGGSHYAQSRTVSASDVKKLYNGVKPFYDDYKDVTTQLNDSHLGSYIASSLSFINKLIDVSAATGGASTDHDSTDALDKTIQSVRAAR